MFTAQLWHFLAVHRPEWPPHAHFIWQLFHGNAAHVARVIAWAKAHGFVYQR